MAIDARENMAIILMTKPLRRIPSIVSGELTRSSTVKQCKRILLIVHDPRREAQQKRKKKDCNHPLASSTD